jgi:plasmid maintenance system antidote protein VapI
LTYRKFSEEADFPATNFLKAVIDGKRNLTSETIKKITAYFDFNKKERIANLNPRFP